MSFFREPEECLARLDDHSPGSTPGRGTIWLVGPKITTFSPDHRRAQRVSPFAAVDVILWLGYFAS